MGSVSMSAKRKQPEIIVFAGPNGSGKSTVTTMAKVIKPYINADDIKASAQLSDMEAAKRAEKIREDLVEQGKSFTFETVLSTDRNIKLLEKAKAKGYFIRCIYVLTVDPKINVLRVKSRVVAGGHPVPAATTRLRYNRALKLIPRLVKTCDICHIYDNSVEPFRIFKKRKDSLFVWESPLWSKEQIVDLVLNGKRTKKKQ